MDSITPSSITVVVSPPSIDLTNLDIPDFDYSSLSYINDTLHFWNVIAFVGIICIIAYAIYRFINIFF